MAQIRGVDGMTPEQINFELGRGGKFVIFQYCISIVVMTFKRGSDIHFIKVGEPTLSKSMGYSILTFFLGWWGFPWGPIYTIGSLYHNFRGGKNVTDEVLATIFTREVQSQQ